MNDFYLNCDFYEYLTKPVIAQLECLQKEFRLKPWFDTAWNRYRNYILQEVKKGSTKFNWPNFIFNEYLKQEFEEHQKLIKRPIEIREGLWKCINCDCLITDSGKTLVESKGWGPTSCPKCGMKFTPTRRQ